ncbi:hypothetical protein FQN54_001146 [Arachnomyces sp. PD_36]|nr:hypothetical protein FQN54_001146 [Arachnomyces sp. PD_36]
MTLLVPPQVKPGRRISSLLSIGSAKEAAAPRSSSASTSPNQSHSPNQGSVEEGGRNRLLRHSASAHNLSSRAPVVDNDAPLLPPPSLVSVNQDLADSANNGPGNRPRSAGGSRPTSSGGLGGPRPRPGSRPVSRGGDSRQNNRMSWFLGGKNSRRSSTEEDKPLKAPPKYSAWVAGLLEEFPYDLNPLVNGEKIPELWDADGDTFVYLFPQNTGRPASFRVDSAIFASSPSLTFLARGSAPGGDASGRHLSTAAPGSPPLSPEDRWSDHDNDSCCSTRVADEFEDGQELHLYLPVPLNSDLSTAGSKLDGDDVETLLLFRNFFAFLLGQALISTPKHPTLFSVFVEISTLLGRFEFTNFDGSNYGETATTSFVNYCQELKLDDLRTDVPKTIEAIVLGEKMRSFKLFYEGFVHTVGKFDDIRQLNSSTYRLIHPTTQKRLERAYLDLENRKRGIANKLDDFDFPSLFAGIANSNVASEGKFVRFKAWKAAFLAYRKNTMSYYRNRFGSWPPKANQKKNGMTQDGLNRLVIKELYKDMTDLYDMLVDRSSVTTRTTDMATPPISELDNLDAKEYTVRALRHVMSEYDRSTPPVQPPIPFDLPLIPDITSIKRKKMDAKKEAKEQEKKRKDSEINEILVGSYHHQSMKATPFLEEFMRFERRSAHGKNINEMADLRCGQWLFMYAVLQSLPMLAMDAPNLQYSEGVEYFLCVPPRGSGPWVREDSKGQRSWFGVANGTGVVSLPSDTIGTSVEGIYRSSHCWQAALKWADQDLVFPAPVENSSNRTSSLASHQPPQSSAGSSSDPHPSLVGPGANPSMISLPARGNSPGINPAARHSNRQSIHLGLEALPLPVGVTPVEHSPVPNSKFNPDSSFDKILQNMGNDKKDGKDKKKK